jgi:Domain of unknown function (DUF4157)
MLSQRSDKQAQKQSPPSPAQQSAVTDQPLPEQNFLWQSLALCPGMLQPKLTINSPGDIYEQEADRVAEQVMQGRSANHHAPTPIRPISPQRKEQSGERPQAADAPSNLPKVLSSAGWPLDADTRAFFEPRLGSDFSQVRVHTDEMAAKSAQGINALAYTSGQRIAFAAGAYQPQTTNGKRLLAHELTHVLQQSGGDQERFGRGLPHRSLSPASSVVQRQSSPAAPAAPTFSVNQATYTGLLNGALALMSGRLVENETLVTTVVPILQAMLANPTWKDAQGATSGGGTIQHTLSGGVVLNLQLILNDAANPTLAGEFTHRGSTDGEMEIFIQSNATAEALAETLYHESMHMVSWLINRATPALSLRSRGRSGSAGAAATLDLARSTTQISTVRMWLDTLAQSVNARRAAGAQISASALDGLARWLIEEVNVRIETEVFRLASVTQQALTTRGPVVFVATGTNWQINAGMVNRYVFDLSRVFLPTDRAGLTSTDQQSLATLTQILEGIFQSRVRRRFNPSPYLTGRGIPRAQFQWTPPPLTPPSFRPLPTP